MFARKFILIGILLTPGLASAGIVAAGPVADRVQDGTCDFRKFEDPKNPGIRTSVINRCYDGTNPVDIRGVCVCSEELTVLPREQAGGELELVDGELPVPELLPPPRQVPSAPRPPVPDGFSPIFWDYAVDKWEGWSNADQLILCSYYDARLEEVEDRLAEEPVFRDWLLRTIAENEQKINDLRMEIADGKISQETGEKQIADLQDENRSYHGDYCESEELEKQLDAERDAIVAGIERSCQGGRATV